MLSGATLLLAGHSIATWLQGMSARRKNAVANRRLADMEARSGGVAWHAIALNTVLKHTILAFLILPGYGRASS